MITIDSLTPSNVPLGAGPPTKEELLVHYPAKFTWHELKTFINAGDLGLLKRNKKLQKRYSDWFFMIEKQYGSSANYLNTYRLQWGKPDTKSLLRSTFDDPISPSAVETKPTTVAESLTHFTANTPEELISIILNDWPYSVPPEVEHTLVWTTLPIIDFSKVPPQITERVKQDGIWGFTGSDSPPPSPSTLPDCLPALSDWGVTMDQLTRSPQGTKEEDDMVRKVGEEVDMFVRKRWKEREWETAWFVNPPRLQSVPDLSHIHVFARRKTKEEIERFSHST